jgi:hypothetical protein
LLKRGYVFKLLRLKTIQDRAKMMFAQRFTGLFNVRDRTIITTGVAINIAIPNHIP